jgi:putative heme-binding domain-containing protein
VRRLKLSEGDTDAGKAVFTKHCANCHRRGTEGKLVGPQLDGIGTRGAPRLLEDILHPNQNVDLAFRTSVLVLNDGRIVSGLVRETRDPQLLEVIDTTGNLITVKKQDVEERKDSTISMMPGNVSKLLTEDNLLNLIRWLLK